MNEVQVGATASADSLGAVVQQWSDLHRWDGCIYTYKRRAADGSRHNFLRTSASAQHLVSTYYARRFDEIDPVAREVGHCEWPISWSLDDFEAGRRTRIMAELLDACGFAAGVSIPIHGPGNTIGTLVMLSAKRDIPPGMLDETVRDAFPLAIALARGVRSLGEAGGEPRLLSAREIECLSWVAAGKTSWEIAKIVGITPRTVEFHVRNCTQKLGCTSRCQAVSRATRLGLLADAEKRRELALAN